MWQLGDYVKRVEDFSVWILLIFLRIGSIKWTRINKVIKPTRTNMTTRNATYSATNITEY